MRCFPAAVCTARVSDQKIGTSPLPAVKLDASGAPRARIKCRAAPTSAMVGMRTKVSRAATAAGLE